MKKDNLNSFNVGGSHQMNPLGGIPIGMGNNGQSNSVEEGETKKSDFVYSDRIQLNKEMLKILNLPKSFEGKTIADASKFVDSKFKDRLDKISTTTKNSMLDKIAQVQEAEKIRQQSEISNALDVNSTEMDLPNNQMFLGGDLDNIDDIATEDTPNPYLSGIQPAMNTINSLISGDKNQALNSGIKTGTTIAGSIIGGPIGGMVGGFVGDVAGNFLNKNANKKALLKERQKDSLIGANQFNNDFALGGPIRNPLEGTLDDNLLTQQLSNQYNNQPFPNGQFKYNGEQPINTTQNWYDNNSPYMNMDRMNPINNTLGKANLKPAVDWAKNNFGDVLRYAPIAANAYQLSKLKSPDKEVLNRLDQRFTPEYVDERTLQNTIGSEYNNTINSISGATNGSLGALRSNLLGAGLNKTKALSDAYINTTSQNRAMNLQGQQFNLGVNQTNLNQDNLEKDINARNKGAFDTNKSRLIGQIGNDLGNIGKEEVYKKIARETLGYTWDGEYWIKPDGTKKSDADLKKEVESKNNKK